MKQHKPPKAHESQHKLSVHPSKEDQRSRLARRNITNSDQEENSPPSPETSPVSSTLAINDRKASHRPNHHDDNSARHAFEDLQRTHNVAYDDPAAAGRAIDRDDNTAAADDNQMEDYAPPPAFSTTNGLLNSGTSTKPWESRSPRGLSRRGDECITDDDNSSPERRGFTSKRPSQNVVEVVIETPPPLQMKSEPLLQSTPCNTKLSRSSLSTTSSTPPKSSAPNANTNEVWDVDNWGERSPSMSPRYTNRRRTNGESANGMVGRTEPEMRHIRESPTKALRKPTARQNMNLSRVASLEKSALTHKVKSPLVANTTKAHTPTFSILDDDENDDELHATYGSDSEYTPISPGPKVIFTPKIISTMQPAIAPAPYRPGTLVPFMGDSWNLPRDELLPGLDERQFQWLAAFWNAYGDDVKIPYQRAETVVRMSGCLKMAQVRRFWNVMRRRKRRDNKEKMPSAMRETEGDDESMEEEALDNVCVTCGKACLHCEAARRTEHGALEDKVNAIPATQIPSTSAKRKREENVDGEKRRKSKRCAGEGKRESVTSRATIGDGENGEALDALSIDNNLSPTITISHDDVRGDLHKPVDKNSRGEKINLLESKTANATTASPGIDQGERHGKGIIRIDKVDVAETVTSDAVLTISPIVPQGQFESPDLDGDHIEDISISDVSVTILASGVVSQDQLKLLEMRDDTLVSETPVDEVGRRRSTRIRTPIYEDLNERRVARHLLQASQAAEKEMALSKRHRYEQETTADTSDIDSAENVPASSRRSAPARTNKRQRFEVDANASIIESTNETAIVTHARALNDWRRIPLENVHLQRNRCTNFRYQKMPRCRACTRKQSDDTVCRFQTFRAFEILHPPLAFRKDLFTIVQTKENINIKNYEAILNVPLFISSSDPDPQYRIARPNRSNESLRSRSVEAFVLRSISRPLEAMLTRELAHSKENSNSFRRLPAPYVRHLCDYCLTSIFNSYWTCSACGVDMCIECFQEWHSKIRRSRGKVPTVELDRRSLCTQDTVHTNDQMLRMTKFTKETLENVRKATAIAKNNEWEKYPLMEDRLVERDVEEGEEVEFELEGKLSMTPFAKAITERAVMEDAPDKKPRAGSAEYAPTPESLDQATRELSRSSQQRTTPPTEQLISNADIFSSSPLSMGSVRSDSPLQSSLPYSLRPLSPSPISPPTLSFLCAPAASTSLSDFQGRWCKGEAVIIRDILSESKIKWAPEYFIQNYGGRDVDVIDCETGEAVESTVEKFFAGFEDLEKREKRPDGKFKVLKLKDWPPRQDFKEEFPALYEDFMSVLPFKDYTGTNGALNLASRLPDTFVPPDLGPKMYIAYGSDDGEQGKGTTNLHCDMADAVNVMFYSSPIDQTSERKKVAAAVWDIYPADDLAKIKRFLAEHARDLKRKLVDPVHDQWIYLDATLRSKLWEKYRVRSWRVYQDPGDAVFIPAGCAHQVCNYAAAVKCAMDFVSPENVARCADLTQEFRLMKRRKEDMLQLRNILFFAWASCDRFLGEASRERKGNEKVRRSKKAEGSKEADSKEAGGNEPWCESVGSKLVLEVPWDEFIKERDTRRLKVRKNEEMYARAAAKKRETIAKNKKVPPKDVTGLAEDWEESASDVTVVSRGTPEPGVTNGRGTPPTTTLEMREEGEESLGDEVTAVQKASVRKLRGRKEDSLSDGAEFKNPETAKGGRGAKKVSLSGREDNLQNDAAVDSSPDPEGRLSWVTMSTPNATPEDDRFLDELAATNTSKTGKGDRKSKAKQDDERAIGGLIITSTPGLFNSERKPQSKLNDIRATPSPAKRRRKPIVKESPGDEEFQTTSSYAKRGRPAKRGRKPLVKAVANGEEPAKRGRKPLVKKPMMKIEGGETTPRRRGRPPKLALAAAERKPLPRSPPRGEQMIFDTITVERGPIPTESTREIVTETPPMESHIVIPRVE